MQRNQEQINILLRSLAVAFVSGAAVVLLQYFILFAGFYFLNASLQVKVYASQYFHIYVWAAPAVLGLYTFNGWFVGMQDAKVPMFVAIGINVVNIVLSFVFVYGFILF